jgi:hypothetical protein
VLLVVANPVRKKLGQEVEMDENQYVMIYFLNNKSKYYIYIYIYIYKCQIMVNGKKGKVCESLIN